MEPSDEMLGVFGREQKAWIATMAAFAKSWRRA
jgi:hypothetical protein